ncbi:Protein MIZU-KUSSEI 1-like plant protein, partial [Dioscorea alata]
ADPPPLKTKASRCFPSPVPTLSLVKPPRRSFRSRPLRLFGVLRSVFRTLPIFNPKCKPPCHLTPTHLRHTDVSRNLSSSRVTGTLFGYRKGRVSLSIQESPSCLPTLIIELAMQTQVLLRDMSSGMVRIALECEKRPGNLKDHRTTTPPKLLNEPLWTMFSNGKKNGYGLRRDPNEEDISIMELLRAVSMGAGVLPTNSESDGPDSEIAYVRATFEHAIGSRDSETFYMLSPEGNNGPELTIFFVRI